MSTDLQTTHTTNLPATIDQDAMRRHESHAASTNSRLFEGVEIKFTKGDWICKREDGEDDPLPAERFIAHVQQLAWMWTKWVDKKPVARRFGLVGEEDVPSRSDLGDTDEADWPRNEKGERVDPWQEGRLLPLMTEDGGKFVYTTTSYWGRKAIGSLEKAWLDRFKKQGHVELPLIELSGDTYPHHTFGKVHRPILHILGWNDNAQAGDDVADDDVAGEMNDEIPF